MKCFCKLIWVVLIMQENCIWAPEHYAKDDMRVPSILQLRLHPLYKVKGIDNNASPTLNCLEILKISHAQIQSWALNVVCAIGLSGLKISRGNLGFSCCGSSWKDNFSLHTLKFQEMFCQDLVNWSSTSRPLKKSLNITLLPLEMQDHLQSLRWRYQNNLNAQFEKINEKTMH